VVWEKIKYPKDSNGEGRAGDDRLKLSNLTPVYRRGEKAIKGRPE